MNAEIDTLIRIEGESEDLYEALRVIRTYAVENAVRYEAEKDCAYLPAVSAESEGNTIDLKDADDRAVRAFAKNSKGHIDIDAQGPYGVCLKLSECRIFEDIAQAAPSLRFSGEASGFITGADVSLKAELADGKLYIEEYYMADETIPDAFTERVEKAISFRKFCSILKADKDDIDEEEYPYFIQDVLGSDELTRDDFNQYLEYWGLPAKSEKDYNAIISDFRKLGIPDYDDLRRELEEKNTIRKVFDPVEKKYI